MERKTWLALILGISLLAAVWAPNGFCQPPPQEMELSRSMALTMAIRKNIDQRIQALNSALADTSVTRSKAYYDPLFTASANRYVSVAPGDPFFKSKSLDYALGLTQNLPTGGSITLSPQTGYTTARFGTPAVSTTDWQTSVGLAVYQPLLRNAGKEVTNVNITLAESSLKESIQQFRFSTADTVLATIISYNRLYTLRLIRDWRATNLNSAQEFLEEIKKKKPGSSKALEVANAEYALSQRQRDLVDAERNVSDQEADLRYLIGIEAGIPIIPTDPPSRDEPPETEVQAVQEALQFRQDLNQLRSTLKTSRLLERVAGHQSLPDLALTASGGITGIGSNFSDSTDQVGSNPGTFWSAGLQFSYPLGNNALESDYIRNKFKREQAQTQVHALMWRIRKEIESDMRALISARIQLQTADRSLKFAEQRHEEYRKGVTGGTVTVQNAIDAENDLILARNTQWSAVENFSYYVAKLWRDAGVLLDRLSIHVDTSHPADLTEQPGPIPVSEGL